MEVLNKEEIKVYQDEEINTILIDSLNCMVKKTILDYINLSVDSKALDSIIEQLKSGMSKRRFEYLMFSSLDDCCPRKENFSSNYRYKALAEKGDCTLLVGLYVAFADFENFYYICKFNLEKDTNIKEICSRISNFSNTEFDNNDEIIYECILAYNEKILDKIKSVLKTKNIYGVGSLIEENVFDDLVEEIDELIFEMHDEGVIAENKSLEKMEGQTKVKTYEELISELDKELLVCKEGFFNYVDNNIIGKKKIKRCISK